MNVSVLSHVLFAGALAVSTAAAQLPQLLTPISNPSATAQAFVAKQKTNNRAIVGTSFVRVNTAALLRVQATNTAPFASFNLGVFGKSYVFDVNRLSSSFGYRLFQGKVQGHEGDITITVAPDGVVYGVIQVGTNVVEVGYAGDPGFHVLRKIDGSLRPPNATPIPVSSGNNPGLPAHSRTANSGLVYWDVLMVYTPAAKTAAGGTSSVEAECVTAIGIANTANTTSSVDAEFRLAYMAEAVGYTEGTFGQDLSRLRSTSDGIMDEVHTWRAKYCADMVLLLRASTATYCGIGYLMTTPGGSAAFASNAFSVAHRNCISYNSCTHEMGHNMGCNHDRANAGTSAIYSYSYGYRTSGSPVYRTLMAYAPGTRVSRWSSPSVVYSGQTMGTATEDNARSLNNVKSIVADWVGSCGSSAACELVYYDFNTGRGATAVNQATGTDTVMTGTDPWTHPARYGPSMLKGQPGTSTAWAESEFKGPITGDLSIHWWMKERAPLGTGVSYLLGGLGSFRGFTNGVAGKEFWLRAWGGADLRLPTVGADLQTRAQDPNGVCVTLTIDGTANVAQWYIDGAAHGAAITITTGVNVAAYANGFRVGKHTSDSSSSRYDLDEFRMVNRVATTAEIAMWCAGPNSLYFHFDRGREDVAVNYGNPVPGTLVTGGLASAWQSPGRYGSSMLAGSNNSISTEYNYCDTGFAGPIHGGVTIAWWMGDANPNSTATFSYLWGGIGSFRCFTGGVAGTGLWFRGNGATDIKYTGDIQTAAKARGGVHVAVAVDAVGLTAQWYIDGVATGAAQAIPNAIATAAAGSFNIGKHTSNTNSSRYHLDEFRMENRCATPAEIKAWFQSSTAGYGPLGTQCGLATGALGGPPTVGNSDYAHTIAATIPGTASCLFVVGVFPTPSFDMGLAFPSLAGCRWYPAFDFQVPVTAAGGSVIIPGGVPNNPALAGLHLTTQVLGVQGGTILQSNAIDHAIEIN